MKKLILSSLTLLSVATSSLFGQSVLDITGTASVFGSYYSSGMPMFGLGPSSSNSFAVATIPRFSYDFSTPGSTVLTLTLQAPEGKEFVIDAPAGWTTSIQAKYSGGSAGSGGGFSTTSPTITFGGLSGSFTNTSSLISLTGAATPNDSKAFIFSFSGDVAGGTQLKFNYVTVSATIPADYLGVYSNVYSSEFGIYGTARYGTGNPGQWMTLSDAAAIPEPSTYAAVAGALALGLAGWRRSRRA